MRKPLVLGLSLVCCSGLSAQKAGTSAHSMGAAAGSAGALSQPKPPKAAPPGASPTQEIQMTARVFAPGFRFSSESTLIEIPVVVRDAHGNALPGLIADDFRVTDDGKAVKVTLFETDVRTAPAPPASALPQLTPRAAPAPATPRLRSIALLFDDLNLSMNDLHYAQLAAKKYVTTGWRPGDQVAVLTTSEKVSQNFTGDRDAVAKAIDTVFANSEITGGAAPTVVTQRSALTSPIHAGGNSDEMLEVLSQHTMAGIQDAVAYTGRQPGDKVVVLASTGFPTYFPANGMNLEHEMDLLVNAALHTQVVVNALDAAGLVTVNDGNTDPLDRWQYQTNVLSEITQDTGGTFFENGNALAQAADTMAGGPEVSYLLGFSPLALKEDGSYHKLTVKLNRDHVDVQARVGYYAPSKVGSGSIAVDLETNLDKALAGGAFSQLPATMTAQNMKFDDGAGGVHVVVDVDAKALAFQRQEGRDLERLRFVAILLDPAGKYVMGQEGIMNLNLSDSSRDHMIKTGLKAGLELPAPPGTYQIRVVVQEGAKGLTTALSQSPFTVP